MRLALVLTGLLRCYEKAYPSFKSYFLDRFDTDVYFDIWDEVGYYSGKAYLQSPSDMFISTASGDRGFHDSGEKVDLNRLRDIYDPIGLNVHRFSSLEGYFDQRAAQFTNAFTRPKNTIAQAFKIYSGATRLVKNYDIVVRARPDIMLESDPGVSWVDAAASGKGIFTLPSRNKMGTGTGDSLMIGSQELVATFATHQFDSLEKIYAEVGVSCPHIFTQYVLAEMINGTETQHFEMNVNAQVAHSPRGLYQEPV